MRVTVVPYDLLSWRQRLGWTQAAAASALGLSESAYRCAEYRAQDRPGAPVSKTLALLAALLERTRT